LCRIASPERLFCPMAGLESTFDRANQSQPYSSTRARRNSDWRGNDPNNGAGSHRR
jgi:hypothetical protein